MRTPYREKPVQMVATCPHCHAVKMGYKNKPQDWQTSIVVFDTLPQEICPECRKKNSLI